MYGKQSAVWPERLGKSAQIRFWVGKDRAELTEQIAGITAQIRWLELDQWPSEVRNFRNSSE